MIKWLNINNDGVYFIVEDDGIEINAIEKIHKIIKIRKNERRLKNIWKQPQ